MFKAVDCTSDMPAQYLVELEERMSRDSWDYCREMTTDEAFKIAGSIECLDGVYQSPHLPGQVAGAQLKLGEDIFDFIAEKDHYGMFARQGAYSRCRKFLEARFPHIHANISDPWAYETYSELYKDRTGCRPRGHITGKEMRAWLKSLKPIGQD